MSFFLAPEPEPPRCQTNGNGICDHVLYDRCPNPQCRREMYAPSVVSFSHGMFSCACGLIIALKKREDAT